MGRERLSLNITRDGEQRDFLLELDEGEFTQRLMLEPIRRGQPYEPQTTLLLHAELRDGHTFVDVGAHIGYFSILAAVLVGPTGKVISFEPEAQNYEHLRANISLNQFEHVRAFNHAVGDRCAEVELFVNLDNDGGHALWNVGRHPFNERSQAQQLTRRVEMISLDRALADVATDSIGFIKVDTEGGELSVLRGARNLLSNSSVPVICEINAFGLQQMGTSEYELRAYMAGLGYIAYAFVPGTLELEPVPVQQLVGTHEIVNLIFRK